MISGCCRPQASRAQPKGQGWQVPIDSYWVKNSPSLSILQDCWCLATNLEIRECHCQHFGCINIFSVVLVGQCIIKEYPGHSAREGIMAHHKFALCIILSSELLGGGRRRQHSAMKGTFRPSYGCCKVRKLSLIKTSKYEWKSLSFLGFPPSVLLKKSHCCRIS